jgi:NTP pyrophosphatase (non-canonical NTP hydrolase)
MSISVFTFAEAMATELANNRHKGGWESEKVPWLLNRAEQELRELKTAIRKKRNPNEVLSEAADVANFCMMIVDNYTAEIEEAEERKANSGSLRHRV